jgi:hypothetical protein
LQWFIQVLTAGHSDARVHFIVVFGHLPVFYPIRKFSSSGMLTANSEGATVRRDCPLLEAMRTHNVDLFLVGDVHHNTVTRDRVSNLVQFVHRGNGASNIAVFDIGTDASGTDTISVTHYRDDGYVIGSFTIRKPAKGNPTTITQSTGTLVPIVQDGLILHYSFDSVGQQEGFNCSIPLWKGKRSFHKFEETNILPPTLHHNTGSFGSDYSIFGSEATQDGDGVFGDGIQFSSGTAYLSAGHGLMSPMAGAYPRTVALWVKTTSGGNRLLFQNCKVRQSFNLGLMDGKFTLELAPGWYVRTSSVANVLNGQWHHVGVTITGQDQDTVVQRVALYVDGEQISNEYSSDAVRTSTIYTDQFSFPSMGFWPDRSRSCCREWQAYVGSIDDFAHWARGLSATEMRAVYDGKNSGKNALAVEAELPPRTVR